MKSRLKIISIEYDLATAESKINGAVIQENNGFYTKYQILSDNRQIMLESTMYTPKMIHSVEGIKVWIQKQLTKNLGLKF